MRQRTGEGLAMSRLQASGKLGIVFALSEEEHGFRQVLSQSQLLARRQGPQDVWIVGNVEASVEVSGVGRGRCAGATDRLIERGAQWIVCAGFAAGLDEELRLGDIVVADRVLLRDAGDAEPIACGESLAEAVPPSGTLGYAIRRSDLVTSDAAVYKSSEKNQIHLDTGAGALDMESYGAAEVCRRRCVPFLAIRSISDTAGQDLCEEIEQLVSMEGRLSRAGFVLSRPHLWKDILVLRGQARNAAKNLGDVLGIMLLRLI